MFWDNEKRIRIQKQEAVLSVYASWVELYQKGKTVSDYLKDKGYQDIAVYGLGRLGQNLIQEFTGSGIHIVYCVDKAVSMREGSFGDIKCYNPMSRLPEAEMIIVTVPYEASEIIKKLNGAVYQRKEDCLIIDIKDLINEIK